MAYSLQYSGTQLSLKDLLKTTARGLQIMFFNSLSIVEVITSKPGEVIGFILSIFLIMSSSSKRVVKDVRQGKSFQKYPHIQYCSVLSLGANVNTRRMQKRELVSLCTQSIHNRNYTLGRPQIFQTMISVRSNNLTLNCQRFTPSGFKNKDQKILVCVKDIPLQENYQTVIKKPK